ncbi:hypothetical protein BBJ28_00010164 [Nothophytophthora sp. Chile5]|nr:hypothetical protein BBJ28_00010164 [Nothophytophthora sp. Chile5]
MKELESGTPGYDSHASPKPYDDDTVKAPLAHPSIWLLLAVSLPRMAIQMAWSAQWAALGPYLSTMLPNFAVQVTQFIGPIVGVLVGPTIGVFSDRTTSRFGRRRPYLMVAGVGSVICWIAMGYTREMGDALGDHGNGTDGEETDRTWTSVFTVFFYLWMDITVNIVQTPAFLLIADFSGDRQTTGAALGQAWSTLGSILVAGYIELIGPAYNSLHGFLGMLSAVMALCVSLACWVAKETPLDKSKMEQVSACNRVGHAFGSIYHGLRTLPRDLVGYCAILFCIQYGYAAYNGNKGQFFGLEVKSLTITASVSPAVVLICCTTSLATRIRGLPFLVSKVGVKWVMTISTLPQTMLLIMAWTSNVTFDVFVVAITGISQSVVMALLVPAVIHVFGQNGEIGVYVGALNSANCFGQLLNFAIGAAVVDTSLGYKLPVFLGGVMAALSFFIALFLFKIKMYSM